MYGLPFVGVLLPELVGALLGLGFYTSAFVAEAVRAGILSVGRGQLEAARSLGLSYGQTMRLVVLPQALRRDESRDVLIRGESLVGGPQRPDLHTGQRRG